MLAYHSDTSTSSCTVTDTLDMCLQFHRQGHRRMAIVPSVKVGHNLNAYRLLRGWMYPLAVTGSDNAPLDLSEVTERMMCSADGKEHVVI